MAERYAWTHYAARVRTERFKSGIHHNQITVDVSWKTNRSAGTGGSARVEEKCIHIHYSKSNLSMTHPKHIKRKSLLIYLVMFVLAIGIVSQVAYTQAFESHIWNPENYNITRLVEVDASRGIFIRMII